MAHAASIPFICYKALRKVKHFLTEILLQFENMTWFKRFIAEYEQQINFIQFGRFRFCTEIVKICIGNDLMKRYIHCRLSVFGILRGFDSSHSDFSSHTHLNRLPTLSPIWLRPFVLVQNACNWKQIPNTDSQSTESYDCIKHTHHMQQ